MSLKTIWWMKERESMEDIEKSFGSIPPLPKIYYPVKKYFPPQSELYHLFNTKKVKMSYSCCPSMKNIIDAHNKKVTGDMQDARFGLGGCNCQGGSDDCPLQGRCKSRGLVYKATVSSVKGEQDYLGQTTTKFELWHSNHTNSYRDPSKKKQTSPSKYVWELAVSNV